MVTMDPVCVGGSISNASQVSLSEKAEDQHEAVVGKLLKGVEEAPKPESRAHHATGNNVNIEV